jgi:signal transduction histidine kinase
MVKLQKHSIDVKTVVARTLELARPAIAARKLQLTVALPSEPIWLEADIARMTQVLTNLLTNAAKFTDEGGQIQLTVSAQDHEAVLRISDTGVGISSEDPRRHIDPGRRLNAPSHPLPVQSS